MMVQIDVLCVHSNLDGPHTRACNLAIWHKSVYLIGLARPSTQPCTRGCMAIFRAHGLVTRVCVVAV
ncbi:putative cytosolic iron-sulfur assembly protein 1 [Gossypium arboreum]|uniref:Putative cytosolic iron-sulfur assembly protein 1 n=1 Tax=Gossypium arboreum TaxID=29729 RepID=A0A0B0NEW9_GOSAR|nr:putative cytosolic iron-sulfur assembly protein 1 [Gossypium arboreum]